PDMVLKLSSLLNYMLYECNMPLVPLEKEVKYIGDYVSLEKLRYGKKLDLSVEISGAIQEHQIAPLLLLPFIENSFKHGASQDSKRPWIRLNIWVDEHMLHLQIENSLEELGAKEDEYSYTKGIGLKNVRRRLELLYKEQYELIIRQEASFFVYLKLHLKQQNP
ncbi:MAG: histidine kinase, partial [Bacteroidota bacterium]